MSREHCANCYFVECVETWDRRSNRTETTYVCRRYPPAMSWNSARHQFEQQMPTVNADQWCGEWRADA